MKWKSYDFISLIPCSWIKYGSFWASKEFYPKTYDNAFFFFFFEKQKLMIMMTRDLLPNKNIRKWQKKESLTLVWLISLNPPHTHTQKPTKQTKFKYFESNLISMVTKSHKIMNHNWKNFIKKKKINQLQQIPFDPLGRILKDNINHKHSNSKNHAYAQNQNKRMSIRHF